jgi:homoserine kinase type II
MTVYLVQHVRDAETDVGLKIIGVYSSRELATAAIAQLRNQEGFKQWPDGFSIDDYELDKTFWSDGFVTV